jgi:hypothetical protein
MLRLPLINAAEHGVVSGETRDESGNQILGNRF